MKPTTPTRSARLLSVFEVAGDILLLQLLFVVASLPVVTMLPAALALQRSLAATFVEGRPRPAKVYWENFRWAMARSWKVAVLLPLFMIAAAASIFFWLAADGAVGSIALMILIPLYGMAVAGYVAVLAAVLETSAVETSALDTSSLDTGNAMDGPGDWLRRAWALAPDRAMPLALSVVVMATWLLLLAKLPTLVLVGTGLVPAGLAWWVAAPWVQRRRAQLAAA
jgi:hypothetical protein